MATKNRYYVYVHVRATDGIVFYIGKGTRRRAFSDTGRNAKWKDVANQYGWCVKFLLENASDEDAINFENEKLSNPPSDWQLVNIQPACNEHEISETIHQLVYYDETSPTCLRWKIWNGQTNHCRRDAGDVAGFLQKEHKRYKVSIAGKEMMAHRVVMVLHGYTIPKGFVVNHKDCDSTNNKIDNLEVVTKQINGIKRKTNVYRTLSDKNTSGVTGVVELTTNKRDGYQGDTYAFAYLQDPNGMRINKFYNYALYGKEVAWQLATEFREQKMKEFYGDWYE